MNADLRFHASHHTSIYEFAQSFAGNQPDAFSIDIGIGYLQAIGGVSHLPTLPPRHRLSLPLDVCRPRLRWPTGRGFGAHQATVDLDPFQPNISIGFWEDLEPVRFNTSVREELS